MDPINLMCFLSHLHPIKILMALVLNLATYQIWLFLVLYFLHYLFEWIATCLINFFQTMSGFGQLYHIISVFWKVVYDRSVKGFRLVDKSSQSIFINFKNLINQLYNSMLSGVSHLKIKLIGIDNFILA